uniref:Ephrin RBD domain-containing protein n=1 Tax=Parastrongyloides trichosuri TaxID=131310 RepID=A0A0N4ZQF2_PARTI
MNETFITCHYSGPDNKKAFSNKIIYTKGKGEDISTIFNISKDEKLPVCKNGKNHIYVSNDNKEYSIRYNLTKLDGTFIGTTLYIFSYNEELKEPILFPCRILRLTKVEKKDSGGTKSIINGLTIGLIVCLTIACILIIVLAVLLSSAILRKRRKKLVKFHRKSYCNSNLDMSCSLASSRSKDNTSKFSKSKDSSSNFSKSEEKSLGTKKNNEVLSRNTKNEMNSLKLFSKNNLKSQNTEKKIKDKAMSLSLKTRQRSAEYT